MNTVSYCVVYCHGCHPPLRTERPRSVWFVLSYMPTPLIGFTPVVDKIYHPHCGGVLSAILS